MKVEIIVLEEEEVELYQRMELTYGGQSGSKACIISGFFPNLLAIASLLRLIKFFWSGEPCSVIRAAELTSFSILDLKAGYALGSTLKVSNSSLECLTVRRLSC